MIPRAVLTCGTPTLPRPSAAHQSASVRPVETGKRLKVVRDRSKPNGPDLSTHGLHRQHANFARAEFARLKVIGNLAAKRDVSSAIPRIQGYWTMLRA